MRIFLKAISAAVCSLFFVNLFCMFYYSAQGDIYRKNGMTESIRMPGTRYINASEGFGIIDFDENGYNNMSGERDENYVLLMGSSHMEATYVQQKENTATLLNYLLGGEDEALRVYNIAHAGMTLPDIVKGFQAGIGEFPDSEAVIIEIFSTTFSIDHLQNCLQQRSYDKTSNGKYLYQHLTAGQRLRSMVIGCFPFAKYVINRQLESVELGIGNPFGLIGTSSETAEIFDETAYITALNNVFSLLRREYDKPIIIFYHPYVALHDNGMEIVRDKDTYEIFRSVCTENEIYFLDIGDAFMEAFENDYVVPYGFNNTVMGSGHLNVAGHRIAAEELYLFWKELPEVVWK